jgi:hypothetical protein
MGTSLTAWFDVVMASTVVSTGTGSVEQRSARKFRAAAKGLIGVPRDRFKGLFKKLSVQALGLTGDTGVLDP